MDIVIGTIFWGGLLWLTLAWLARVLDIKPKPPHRVPGTRQGAGATGGSAAAPAPAPPTPRQLPPDEQRLRVDDALVDGLVIGHFLTRDHYQRRIGELEDSIDELDHDRDPWLGGGVDDEDFVDVDDDLEDGTDYAEFDAMGGFGVEPWADDLFDDMDDEYLSFVPRFVGDLRQAVEVVRSPAPPARSPMSHPWSTLARRRRGRRPSAVRRLSKGHVMDLSLQLQHEFVAVQSETDLHVLVELTAPPVPSDRTREPLRIALVVDRSGSMHGAPLEAAKRSIAYLAGQLTGDDQFAIIAYDDQVALPYPLGAVHLDAVQQALAGIGPGGSTNLSGGWLKGIEQLRQVDDGIRRVVLLSDGHANVGITDPTVLARMAGEVAATGISTTTIGFGDGFDEHLMTAIADSGRGTGHFAQSPDDAPGIFAEEFDDLATLVAQNLSVEVRPSADVEVIEVLNTYPSTAVAGGVQVLLGDAFAGLTVRVVLRLRVPAIAQLGLATIGEVVVRWVALGAEVAERTVNQPLVVNAVSAQDAAEGLPNATVVEEVVVLTAGQLTELARDLADQGDLGGAKDLLDGGLARLRDVSSDHPAAGQLRETIAQLEFTGQAMAADSYGPADAKRMHYESRNLRRNKRDGVTPRSRGGLNDERGMR